MKSAPYSSGLTPAEAVPLMPASMGHPQPAASSSGLSSQHERLILERMSYHVRSFHVCVCVCERERERGALALGAGSSEHHPSSPENAPVG